MDRGEVCFTLDMYSVIEGTLQFSLDQQRVKLIVMCWDHIGVE